MAYNDRIYLFMIALAAASLPLAAQRLDGCSDDTPMLSRVSDEARDRGLRDSGYSLSGKSVVAALSDPRADVRSLAAETLVSIGQKADVALLTHAWSMEKDHCTKAIMSFAIPFVLVRFWGTKPNSDALRVAPFQVCTPSGAVGVSLTLEEVRDGTPSYRGPTVRFIARNQTAQILPFLGDSLTKLFSVAVLDPSGQRAKIPIDQMCLYGPCDPGSGLTKMNFIIGKAPVFMPLLPHEDLNWLWEVGRDFDMSAPGTYSVSLGGRLDYLEATVCSNTAYVTVK